jgi:hypothetical protein
LILGNEIVASFDPLRSNRIAWSGEGEYRGCLVHCRAEQSISSTNRTIHVLLLLSSCSRAGKSFIRAHAECGIQPSGREEVDVALNLFESLHSQSHSIVPHASFSDGDFHKSRTLGVKNCTNANSKPGPARRSHWSKRGLSSWHGRGDVFRKPSAWLCLFSLLLLVALPLVHSFIISPSLLVSNALGPEN